MSAKKFIQLLEDNGVLDPSTIREVKRQISDKKVSAATVAKALVEKGKLTKFQATKLVGEATATGDSESGDLLAIDDSADEVVMLEDASADSAEEVVGLTPVEDAGAALTPVQPPGLEPIDARLEPIDAGGGGLESLDDFGDASADDPFGQQSPTPTQAPEAEGKPKKKREKKNQQDWGGKLMIGGGGMLLFLVLAGGLLWWSLNSEPALRMFERAEEGYREESYSQAAADFEKYLKQYPNDENADNARVRIALCRIRIVIGDPQKAYDTAMEVLPTVQELEAFSPARDELASLLPSIPEGFLKKAKQTEDANTKEELLGKAKKALADLVDKPEYIPASKRDKERLDRINEDVLIVQRSIDQNRDLAKAIVDINEKSAANETVAAYTVYKELLNVYPGLVDDEGLKTAVRGITERLKNLVKLEEESIEALTDKVPSQSEFRVVLASRTTNAQKGVPRLNGQVVAVLAAGSVYGIDAGTGAMLWRHYVGNVTQHAPQPLSNQPGADILVCDQQRNELSRIKANSGELVWRLPVAEDFAAPTISGDHIFVSTESGKVLQVDAATGSSSRRVVLPQEVEVAAGVAQIHPYLIQLGDHSNLYAISTETLECKEVKYFAHKAGTIAVPPLVIQDHVLIAENAGTDYCLLHVFKISPTEDGQVLAKPQDPIRLKGNVVVPIALYGRRPLVVTDLGEVSVYNIDFNSDTNTVTPATETLPASHTTPLLSYPVVEGTTLVLADSRLVKYQLQVTTKKITQKAVTNTSDVCLGPPTLFGDILVVTRRKQGSVGTTVSALQVDNFRRPEWETQLGTPIARASAAGNQLDVITGAAALFEVDSNVLKAGFSNEPAATATVPSGSLSFTQAVPLDNGKVAFFNPADNESALIYSPGEGAARLKVVQLKLSGGKATCTPVAYNDGLLTPLDNGSIVLANTTTGDNLLLPFQPELGPGEDVKWQRPAVLGEEFIVTDDRKNIYRIGVKQEPKPFLSPLLSAKLEVDIASDLAAAGDTVYGVVRNSGGDVIMALNAGDLTAAKEFALTGRVVWGPVQVDDAVLCLSSTEGLLCFEAGANQRWANSAGCGGQPVGVPLVIDGDYFFALQRGAVARLSGASGDQVATVQIGEPLGSGPVAFGQRLLLPGNDGALHVIRTPKAGE